MTTVHQPMHRLAARAAPLFVALFAALFTSTAAFAAAPSTELSVSGGVSTPKTYDLAGLAGLPAVTQTVSYGSGSGAQTHTYTGAGLWGLLGNSGIVVDPNVKNDIVNKLVLATGTDGYKVVFSGAELSPDFGNRPDAVAYSELIGGVATSLGTDGFTRVTAPGDVKGGRYVSNLFSLDVRSSGSTQAGTGGGVSSQFSVTGAVTQGMSFNLAALQALPTQTEVVAGISYTGVSFWSLLNATVGIRLDPTVKNDVLGKYVVATGSDGYRAVFSLGELASDFGNQPDLIAFSADGAALGAAGFARVVVPNDVKKGRWVSNLVSLEVLSASPVPEPATAATLLLGLALVLGVARRRSSFALNTKLLGFRALVLAAGTALAALAAHAGDLTVSAAASLSNAFKDLAPLFEAANPGTRLLYNFAASGPLLQQIAKGAPVDVFASADQETMDLAQAQGLVQVGWRRNFVSNALVVIVPGAATHPPAGLKDLTHGAYQRVAIGIPASVPAGRYAKGVLEAEGLWGAIEPKMIGAQNVRQVLDYVARAEVDAGFVYSTDAALMPDKVKVALSVATVKPLVYPAAPVAASANLPLAQKFVEFLGAPQAQAVLAKYGFGKP